MSRPPSAPSPPGRVRAAAVVVAAGRGRRFGAPDKVLLPLGGRPLLARVLDALDRASTVVAVVLVVGPHTRAAAEALVAAGGWATPIATVDGGERRQDSVAAGLAAVPAAAEVVLVHDAARPLVPVELIDRCAVAAAEAETGAAIAAVPVADSLKRVADGRVVATVDRAGLWAAQTPQAFRRDLVPSLIAAAAGADATDEAALCERLGIPVVIVPGLPSNLKVTRPEDLPVAEALLRATTSPGPPDPGGAATMATADAPLEGRARPTTTAETAVRAGRPPVLRTGIGYDVHRFAPGRPLVLGGVAIPHPLGLDGHSDADVLLHAVADALLGAAALGDIGQHFPPTDPRFAGADSRELLARVAGLVAAAGFRPVNVDATVVAEAPRIAPHAPAMRAAIAACLGLAAGDVGVKATTNEGMGFLGRGEGIAALATATLAPAG